MLENSIIVGNDAIVTGGGACIDWGTFRDGQHIYFINSTVVSNSTQHSGGIEYTIQGGNYVGIQSIGQTHTCD